MLTSKHYRAILTELSEKRSEFMQEERFEVFFQNISGLYRAVQRLRAQFADAAGVSSVHLFWLYLLREYPKGWQRPAGGAVQHRSIARLPAAEAAVVARARLRGRGDGKAALRLENPFDRFRMCTGGTNRAGSAFYSKPGRTRDSARGAGRLLPRAWRAPSEFQQYFHYRRNL